MRNRFARITPPQSAARLRELMNRLLDATPDGIDAICAEIDFAFQMDEIIPEDNELLYKLIARLDIIGKGVKRQ